MTQGPLFSRWALGKSFDEAPEGTRSPWGQGQSPVLLCVSEQGPAFWRTSQSSGVLVPICSLASPGEPYFLLVYFSKTLLLPKIYF